MNLQQNFSAFLGISVFALGAVGCAGRGARTGDESLAAARTIAATPPAVSFTQADLDGDARISRQEFDLWQRQSSASGQSAAAGGTREREDFDAADTDVNGVLTLDEWQAMGSASNAGVGGSREAKPRRETRSVPDFDRGREIGLRPRN